MLIKKPKKGKYVTFEGINGVGKTFVLSNFIKLFQSDRFFLVDENLSNFSARIMEALNNDDPFFRSGNTFAEALCWYAIDIVEYKNKIENALNQNRIVLQDRGVDTTAVYAAITLSQELNRDVLEIYLELQKIRENIGAIPDLTFILIGDVDLCIDRIEKRDNRVYSQEEREFLREVDKLFKVISKLDNPRIKVINCDNKNVSRICQEIYSNLESL